MTQCTTVKARHATALVAISKKPTFVCARNGSHYHQSDQKHSSSPNVSARQGTHDSWWKSSKAGVPLRALRPCNILDYLRLSCLHSSTLSASRPHLELGPPRRAQEAGSLPSQVGRGEPGTSAGASGRCSSSPSVPRPLCSAACARGQDTSRWGRLCGPYAEHSSTASPNGSAYSPRVCGDICGIGSRPAGLNHTRTSYCGHCRASTRPSPYRPCRADGSSPRWNSKALDHLAADMRSALMLRHSRSAQQ